MTSWLSELVESIHRATVPEWLAKYVHEHKKDMLWDLNIFGFHKIEGPNGIVITISRKP